MRLRIARKCHSSHGLFLLAFVLLFPSLIHSLPLAALGAMLVYTGFRLASPREFVRMYKVGSEQFLVFMTTIVVTLSTDLLIGIMSGIALEMAILVWSGAPLSSMYRAKVETEIEESRVTLRIRKAAVFSNWLGIRAEIGKHDAVSEIVVDLSQTRVVDHSVMEKLHELEMEFHAQKRHLKVVGLELHKARSAHPLAARLKPAVA